MLKTQIIIAKHNIGLNSFIHSGLILAALIYSIPAFAEDAKELSNLEEAMEFVLSEGRVPNASEVKLQEIHATYSDEMKVWKFTFIHRAKTHIATVDKKSRFKLDSKEDKGSYNELFWSDWPRAEGMLKKDWLYEAENFIRSYNYSLTNPKILSYKVCEPPIPGMKSEYASGCIEDTFRQTWKIVSGVEDRKLAKMVVYGDGQLESFSNVTVELTKE
ncbi:MAG: hypothetical protein V3V18_12915 [Methylococcales bacterium]